MTSDASSPQTTQLKTSAVVLVAGRDLISVIAACHPVAVSVQLRGKWLEILDAHTDREEVIFNFGETDWTRTAITSLDEDFDLHIAVRVIDAEKSTQTELEDAWHILQTGVPYSVLIPSPIELNGF